MHAHTLFASLLALMLAGSSLSRAQFVAFNDHAPGPGTGPNTTAWNSLGADPGSSGFLRNTQTGATLPVRLAIARSPSGVAGAGSQGSPEPGSPLHVVFAGFVDFEGTPNPSVELSGNGAVTYTFSGLNPLKRYSFRGSAVRGNSAYTDRWTLFEITGAAAFTSAHTANTLSSARVPALSAGQAAINTGANHTAETGDMAGWDAIQPGANGEFAVVCRQYTGSVPGGTAGGSKGYAMTGLRLEEIDVTPVPAAITRQPIDQTVDERQPVTWVVEARGNPDPAYRWFKNDVPIGGATNASYAIPAAPLIDDGARFSVEVSNTVDQTVHRETSRPALLRVLPDTTPPRLIEASSVGLSQVKVVFSKPMSETAANPAHYTVTGAGSSAPISSALLDASQTIVLLEVALLTEGADYTVIVDGVRDQTNAGNWITPNSQIRFSTVAYAPVDLGEPALAGAVAPVAGGYQVSGSGEMGGTRDQFHFGHQVRIGNFDLRVRLEDLTITDGYVRAGLMARESLADNARFAAIFASSAQLGCFFQSRSTAGGPASIAGPSIQFPANYPRAWLRLQRTGDLFRGYGSFDGESWQLLGSASLSLPQELYFGMAVSSMSASRIAVAQFREIGPVESPGSFTYVPRREPLGPSNRRTGIIFTEIMYAPPAQAEGKDGQFVEIYNAEPIFIDLTGWSIAGDIGFRFPDGFQLESGQFAVVAADPGAISAAYGIEGVLGPFEGRLGGEGGTLSLLNKAGAIRGELSYASEDPWPVAASGTGHSLVMLRTSFGEDDPRAWGPSQLIGGSPGYNDPIVPNPWDGVVINEFLASPEPGQTAFVELYNAGNSAVDVSGCYLSDRPTNLKFRIPEGTQLQARSWIAWTTEQLGFGLSAAGESLFLVSADQSRVLDAIRFSGQERGVSSGRSPDGGPVVRRLSASTPAAANAAWRAEEVVINELMYRPISRDDDDQYVELYNRGALAVDLSGWALIDGIRFTFPAGATISAGGYAVVARNRERLLTNHPHLNPEHAFGNFSGRLSASGERIVLAKPASDGAAGFSGMIAVLEVAYQSGGRWPELAKGGGSSLELIDPRADPLQASNWAASDETQKAPWMTFEFTGVLNQANQNYAANRIYVINLVDGGDYLLDDIEVFRPGGTNLVVNPGFENGQSPWAFYGTHDESRIEAGAGIDGGSGLRLIATTDGDTGPNSVRGNLSATLAANQTYTLRAKARWLSGWPEILLRVRGNGIELPMVLEVPPNLGTPGLPNSRLVSNAGPAISEVTHYPPVPAANEPVVISARVSDPDGVAVPRVIFRVSPNSATTTIPMRDDGGGGDGLAGDGIYSATIPGRGAGTLIAFRIEAEDRADLPASSTFPNDAPARECLIRWGDPLPFGSFMHYHIWSTGQPQSGLGRKYRDCTFVYGNNRVIYNAGFRNKGSPYHGGTGSWRGTFPPDDKFLGDESHLYRSTGNGNAESTAMAGDMALWIARQLGLPYLHSHYVRVYRNGAAQYNVTYNMEVPNRRIARDWFGGGGLEDTLYKIAVWFEFNDSNGGGTSSTVGAGFQRKPASAPPFKTAAYRFNWQPNPGGSTANDYSLLFDLISAANATDRVTQLMHLADMEQWMRMFAWNRIIGNWDSWSYRVGQNMYLYAPLGQRASLLPWDIDFVLGLGDNANENQLFSANQDTVIRQLFNVPLYRRMMWRAYQDAVNGPLRPEVSGPQFDARRAALLRNGITGTSPPTSLRNYASARRNFLLNQIRNADAAAFTVNSQEPTTSNHTLELAGAAPFAVASIEINGVPYPVTWTSATGWSVQVPLTAVTNVLRIEGKDLRGEVLPGATAELNVHYTGALFDPRDWVVINEIMYQAPIEGAEFIELFNRHPSFAFDLSEARVSGAGFSFAPGTFIQPNGYLVIARDPAAFARAYGAAIPLAGAFTGNLRRGGETLRLIKPGAAGSPDTLIDAVWYANTPPWPANADGLGPSLQLIDPAQDRARPGNWAATAVDNPNRATPGRANSVLASIPEFPPIWINEVQPQNLAGLRDRTGQAKPWIELYNAGAGPVSLAGLWLANNHATLDSWTFPSGAQIGPGEFKVIFADGRPELSSATEWHTSFELVPHSGTILLSRLHNGQPQVLDYIDYAALSASRSAGSLPDGQPFNRTEFAYPTPGERNGAVPPALNILINEWMADNSGFMADPADGQFDDWFELYNAGTATVDLTGFYLTDDLTNPTRFRIPDSYTIPPGGFLLVWADGEPEQNSPSRPDLHVNFSLAKAGEEIGLFAPDGSLIDGVTFSEQASNVSQGFYPDGSDNVTQFTWPTPGAPNRLSLAGPRVEVSVSGGQWVLGWSTTAGQQYRIESKDDLGQPSWTPLGGPMTAPGGQLSVQFEIGQSPQRFYRIVQIP